MPSSASVGETADGWPNTESNFLSTHYLQNHGLGMRPLEGHLGRSPVSRTICTIIVLVTRVPISHVPKAPPGEGMLLSAEVLNSRDFEPFHWEIFPDDWMLQGLFPINMWTGVPGSAEWRSQTHLACWVVPGRCAVGVQGPLLSPCWMPARGHIKDSCSRVLLQKDSKDNSKFY